MLCELAIPFKGKIILLLIELGIVIDSSHG